MLVGYKSWGFDSFHAYIFCRTMNQTTPQSLRAGFAAAPVSLLSPWPVMCAILAVAASLANPAPARAAAPSVSTGECAVQSSGTLNSSEYVYSYSGGCKDGKAEGQGKAQWQLRNAPTVAPVVWQGRFVQGVFLAESATKGARRVDSSRALLDIGAVQAGGKSGRLWVEGRLDSKLPVSACRPISLRLLVNSDLADDKLARQWLQSAHQLWRGLCAGELAALKGRNVQLSIHQGTELVPDSFGNLPQAVVTSYGPLDAASYQPTQFNNKATQAVADQQKQQQRTNEQAGALKRLKDYAQQVGAKRYVDLAELEQNPFRYGEQVLLVAVEVMRVETPVQAVVQPARRVGYGYSVALANGVQVAQWGKESRLLAVRVMGRSKEDDSRGTLSLAVVESTGCKEFNCEDFTYVTGNRWLRDEAL